MKAFPGKSIHRNGMHSTQTINNPGMDLRDYFAAMAMNGLYAGRGGPVDPRHFPDDATMAYEIADAMMARREK